MKEPTYPNTYTNVRDKGPAFPLHFITTSPEACTGLVGVTPTDMLPEQRAGAEVRATELP